MTTPARLVDLRRDRGWSIRKLAEESGASTRTILRIEAGGDVIPSSIRKVATALGVEPLDILEYSQQRARERQSETTAQA